VVLVKLEVVTEVPCKAKVLAVTVPEMGRGVVYSCPSLLTIDTASLFPFVKASSSEAICSGICAIPFVPNTFAVTVPLIAGSEPIVTELPTVTEEMLMGTVPEMLAVTLPICAVPAPMVTVPAPIVTTPMRFVPAGMAEIISTGKLRSIPKVVPSPS